MVPGYSLFDVVIIGSGIAGSVLAYELEKRKIKYLICTEKESPLCNNSILSFGHCRVPKPEDLESIIIRSIEELGENEERMRFIYSNSELVLDLFEELKINHEYRSFGVIPLSNERGGRVILEGLQQKIPSIEICTELVDFSKDEYGFTINLLKNNENIWVRSKYLVLATGGYAGSFEHSDNYHYKNKGVFNIVKRNGGEIINLDCIFIHPFGYCNGRNILIGNETKEGEFVDEKGRFVFNEKTRGLIKNNNYHEVFDVLVKQERDKIQQGSKIYFLDSKRKLEIIPTAHYTPGGIKTDYLGEVIGCKSLFAIGECKADGSEREGRFPWISIYLCYCKWKGFGREVCVIVKSLKGLILLFIGDF